jgi:plastocyanin
VARSLKRVRVRAIAALLGVAGTMGCGSDYVAPATPTEPSRLFAGLVLDHHAIVLSASAPRNTIRLTPTPMSATGAPLSGLPAATYSLSDSAAVAITADGTVTALASASGVMVIASVSAGNFTARDTAYVTVTDLPAPATFSIQLFPGDPGTVPAQDAFNFFNHKPLAVQATDEGGAPIDAIPAHFSSSDPSIATVDPVTGLVTGIRPGTVKIRASTTVYGVSFRDSVVLTVTPPLIGGVNAVERTPVGSTTPVLAFDPQTLTVSAGATVIFVNQSADLMIDVVFDDPTNVLESPLIPNGAGDIAPFTAIATRAFFVPGTYTYHSTLFDTHGTIIVQ